MSDQDERSKNPGPADEGGPGEEEPTTDADAIHQERTTSDGSELGIDADVHVYPQGTHVGRYTIEDLLGVGGMGAVYRATQESPHRTVALKLMKHGVASARSLRRFEFESEVLGKLSHPGIASIHEAGMHEGAPYFAMEFVDGPTLVDYANGNDLGTRERLKLFAQVCEAVHHAHTRGIIHRDLKPQNILVTRIGDPPRAQVKILDFGVARATDSDMQSATMRTDVGQLVGTIPYMSPEQITVDRDEIDPRSDVYALGVVLFELLTGRLPYDIDRKMIHVAARMICHDEPTRLSAINYALRGDVETIVSKALEKSPERRYQTAMDLGADIQHYLRDEPITARPPSTWYQLKKFSKRNKPLVTGVSVAFLMLLLGLAGTSYGLIEASEQRDLYEAAAIAESEQRELANTRAEEALDAKAAAEEAQAEAVRRAEDLGLVSSFQRDQLGEVDVSAMGEQLRESILGLVPPGDRAGVQEAFEKVNFTDVALGTLEENIFDDTIEAIDRQFADRALIRATLLESVGKSMLELGFNDRALGPLRSALELRRETLGTGHELTLASLNELSNYLMAQGRSAEAEPYMREALEGIREIEGDRHQNTITAASNLGLMLMNQGRLEEAEPLLRESATLSRAVLGDRDRSTLISISNLGELFRQMGRLDEAAPLTQEALEGLRVTLGESDPLTITLERNMGGILYTQGRIDDAAPYFERSLEGYRSALGSAHPNTLIATNNLALLRQAQGQLDAAESLWREALAGMRSTLGDAHPETMKVRYNLGGLLQQTGNDAEAEDLLREAMRGYVGGLGPDHPQSIMVSYRLVQSLVGNEKDTEARTIGEDLVERVERVYGAEHRYAGSFRIPLARACLSLGSYEQSVQTASEAREILLGLPDSPAELREAVELLITIHRRWHEAEPDAGHDRSADTYQAELDEMLASGRDSDAGDGDT